MLHHFSLHKGVCSNYQGEQEKLRIVNAGNTESRNQERSHFLHMYPHEAKEQKLFPMQECTSVPASAICRASNRSSVSCKQTR
jgi:hypothetical protein